MRRVRKLFGLILILLTLPLYLTNSVLSVKGQGYGFTDGSVNIHVFSPIENQTYYNNTIPLNFNLETNIVNSSIIDDIICGCTLDGELGYHDGHPIASWNFNQTSPSSYNTTINVPNGNHLLWVQVDFWYYWQPGTPVDLENLSQIVSFSVDSASPSPNPSAPLTSMQSQIPTVTSAVPELSLMIIVPLLLSMFFVALIIRHRKTSNSNQ